MGPQSKLSLIIKGYKPPRTGLAGLPHPAPVVLRTYCPIHQDVNIDTVLNLSGYLTRLRNLVNLDQFILRLPPLRFNQLKRIRLLNNMKQLTVRRLSEIAW